MELFHKMYPVGVDLSLIYKRENESIRKERLLIQDELWKQYCIDNNHEYYDKYYTYIYLDPRFKDRYQYGIYVFNYLPFYIGKGTNERFIDHVYEYGNSLKHQTIHKIKKQLNRKPIIMKLNDNVPESIAFSVESELINKVGRINQYEGCLTNKVAGHKWKL